jgi:hypothetical protein
MFLGYISRKEKPTMDIILAILTFLDSLKGYKTYVAAVGLIGLSVYQFSNNDFPNAYQSLMAGLAAFGIRSAIKDNDVRFHAALKSHEAKMLQLAKKD